MEILTIKNLQIIIRRSLSLLLALCLACIWVLLGATPALAQARTINYSHTSLQNRDFSHTDLVGAVFAAAEMRGANFESANLSQAILTQGKLQGANLAGANFTDALLARFAIALLFDTPRPKGTGILRSPSQLALTGDVQSE